LKPKVKAGEKRLGFIVNPMAGIGGRVGLKGSDGAEIQQKALALGAVPESLNRAIQALERVKVIKDDLEVFTYPGEMGEDGARACGFEPTVVGVIKPGETTPDDTQNAVREMLQLNVDLLLFAGGDGTARDMYDALLRGVPWPAGHLCLRPRCTVPARGRQDGRDAPVLGIPAGVKIHSAVFGTSPMSAGDLALSYLRGRVSSLREAEVMDIDEEAFRAGVVSAKLYGYLKIPFQARLVQSLKAASSPGEKAVLEAIACDVVDRMEGDYLYMIGPGTTTRAIASRLGLDKTLIGVDVIFKGKLVAADVNESQLLRLLEGRKAKIVVTPIGGQGYIFGRGNQQISPRVIKEVGADHKHPKDNIIVVSTPEKIHSLRGRPFLVDTGDGGVDRMLRGYVRVVTGYNEQVIYRVA
jgi:predicted polyphosphate/ATP-dependent NAD kinase